MHACKRRGINGLRFGGVEDGYCVVLASKAYVAASWPKQELRAGQERVLEGRPDYIVRLKLDDTIVPGLPTSLGYLDLREHDLPEVATLLYRKVDPSPLTMAEVLPSPESREDFANYCETLIHLARRSYRLRITYVAAGSSEQLFFAKAAVEWFAIQEELCSSGRLRIERVVFFDGPRLRKDEVYRFQTRRIYQSLHRFTWPVLRAVAVDLECGAVPIDLQIFDSPEDARLIVPVATSQLTMHTHVSWPVLDEADPRFAAAEGLFKRYLVLPDHSRYLLGEGAPRAIRPKPVRLPRELGEL